MRELISFFTIFLFCCCFSSCQRQNPVNTDQSSTGFSLSGKIDAWNLGADKSAIFISDMTTTQLARVAVVRPWFGVAKIDSVGDFFLKDIPQPPDSLFYYISGLPCNSGLLSEYHGFIHAYTVSSLAIANEAGQYVAQVFYSTQPYNLYPQGSNLAVVGDYTMFFQYTDRDIRIDSATSSQSSYTLNTTYALSLKKGWNKMYLVLTYLSDTEKRVLWTTDAPKTEGKWYFLRNY